MPGVLVVVGVVSDDLEQALKRDFTLPDWFWDQRMRHMHIRCRLRSSNLCEDDQQWLAHRDFCVSLVELPGETPPHLFVYGSSRDLRAALSAHAGWGGSVSLPMDFEDGCVVSLGDVRGSFSPELTCKVDSTMCQFRDMIGSGKKRRRLNNLCGQMGALARGGPASSVLVPVDEAVPSSSPSSSSVRRFSPTPDWLYQGVYGDLASLHSVRPGLGLPSMSDSGALGILANQLLRKAWETTWLSDGATMFAGNLKPYESGDEVSKIFIRRSNSGFTKSSAKHRFVWIASMEGLESCPQEALQDSLSSFSVEHCGVWALIVGEGRDFSHCALLCANL